jgi:hypothetical protein
MTTLSSLHDLCVDPWPPATPGLRCGHASELVYIRQVEGENQWKLY